MLFQKQNKHDVHRIKIYSCLNSLEIEMNSRCVQTVKKQTNKKNYQTG